MTTHNEYNKHRYWKSVFRRVISRWDEARTTDGTMSAKDYSRKQGGKPAPFCQRIVRPSLTDFIADVELAALAALKSLPLQSAFWRVVYLQKCPRNKVGYVVNVKGKQKFAPMDEEMYKALKSDVQIMVGRMLVDRKIHPCEAYFKAKDLR